MHTSAFVSPLLAGIYAHLFSTASVAELGDGSLQIQSAPGRYLAWILAFVIVLPASWWCWHRRVGGRIAPSAFFASFLIPLIVVPGVALESVRVSPAGLTIRTGFWFSPTVHSISFSDLESITQRSEAVNQRLVPRHDTFWHFRYRSREQRDINLPDLLDAHRHTVIEYLHRHGIDVREP